MREEMVFIYESTCQAQPVSRTCLHPAITLGRRVWASFHPGQGWCEPVLWSRHVPHVFLESSARLGVGQRQPRGQTRPLLAVQTKFCRNSVVPTHFTVLVGSGRRRQREGHAGALLGPSRQWRLNGSPRPFAGSTCSAAAPVRTCPSSHCAVVTAAPPGPLPNKQHHGTQWSR